MRGGGAAEGAAPHRRQAAAPHGSGSAREHLNHPTRLINTARQRRLRRRVPPGPLSIAGGNPHPAWTCLSLPRRTCIGQGPLRAAVAVLALDDTGGEFTFGQKARFRALSLERQLKDVFCLFPGFATSILTEQNRRG